MIRTRLLRSDVSNKSDGKIVLISRYYPRGIRKQDQSWIAWYRELAPSQLLLREVGNGRCGKAEFVRRFRDEMEGEAASARIDELAASHRGGETITLVCDHLKSVPDDWCHRYVVKALVERPPVKG